MPSESARPLLEEEVTEEGGPPEGSGFGRLSNARSPDQRTRSRGIGVENSLAV
jgi:hypothetical protein